MPYLAPYVAICLPGGRFFCVEDTLLTAMWMPAGEYLGPQVSIQLIGDEGEDSVWQAQGGMTVFGMPNVFVDIKFGRGANGAAALASNSASHPAAVTQLPQRDRRNGGEAAAIVIGLEFSSLGMGQLIRKMVPDDFVQVALAVVPGEPVGSSAGLVLSGQDMNMHANPAMELDLETVRGTRVLPRGVTVAAPMRLVNPCADDVCSFLTKHLGTLRGARQGRMHWFKRAHTCT